MKENSGGPPSGAEQSDGGGFPKNFSFKNINKPQLQQQQNLFESLNAPDPMTVMLPPTMKHPSLQR